MGAAKGENQEMIKLKDIRKKKKDDKATMNAKIDPKEKDQEVSSDVEESVNEAEMTAAQKKKREEIVLKMKDKEDEFKKNYGDRWKEVMYATATKMAMKEEVELDEDLAADIRREKEKQARNKARTATANTEIDRNKATDKLHKMGLNRSMDRAKHYDARMKLSGLRKEAAPKIDDKKYSEYMASRQKPVRQSSTKKSLADIRKKAEIYKKEEINLSKKEEIFEANEQTLNTLIEKIHNHVLNGEDYKTVINEITTIGNFGWSSRELTELYIEKYVDINEEINSSLAALYEKHVNEGELTDIAKERIAREKQRDKIKHLQMIARAKVKDLKKEDTPSDREWGTDSLTAKYKKDTPGQND